MAKKALKITMNEEQISSMPIVEIIPTIPLHIGELKENLRPEDSEEILRFGISIQKALWKSYKHSLICKTALINGKVAAVWGIQGTFMGINGIPWLMTTSEVKKVSPLKFARIYQQEVIKMLELFPKLVNWVDAGYTAAIRLLDIVGFELGEPEPMGKHKALYRKFSIGKK